MDGRLGPRRPNHHITAIQKMGFISNKHIVPVKQLNMYIAASLVFLGVDEVVLENHDGIHVNRSPEPNHAQDLNFTSIQLVIYFLKSSYLTHHLL